MQYVNYILLKNTSDKDVSIHLFTVFSTVEFGWMEATCIHNAWNIFKTCNKDVSNKLKNFLLNANV